MSLRHRGQRGRAGAAAIVLIALLAAVAVILVARDHAGLEAELEARAAAADAVAPVAEALRNEMNAAAAGTVAGSKQVALADSSAGHVSSATATRARDTGTTLLEDSGEGVVVAATYDTSSAPASVEERRKHVTGLRVVPLDLGPTLRFCGRPGRIALAGPNRTVRSLRTAAVGPGDVRREAEARSGERLDVDPVGGSSRRTGSVVAGRPRDPRRRRGGRGLARSS